MAEITEKNIVTNRKAQHEYFVHQKFEAGIVLVGTEVKSLRQNKVTLVDSYAVVKNGEVWLLNCNINFGKILYESKIDYIHYKNDLLERIITELTTYAGIYYYDNIFTKDITIKAGINGKYFSRVSNFFDKLIYTDLKNIKYFNFDPKGILNLFAVLNLQTASIYLGIDNI